MEHLRLSLSHPENTVTPLKSDDPHWVALSTWDTNNCASLMRDDSPPTSPDQAANPPYELQGPIRQRQKRLTEAEVAAMAGRYEEGATVYQLAAEFGCNRTTVSERLKRIGLEMRGSRRIDQADLAIRP